MYDANEPQINLLQIEQEYFLITIIINSIENNDKLITGARWLCSEWNLSTVVIGDATSLDTCTFPAQSFPLYNCVTGNTTTVFKGKGR